MNLHFISGFDIIRCESVSWEKYPETAKFVDLIIKNHQKS